MPQNDERNDSPAQGRPGELPFEPLAEHFELVGEERSGERSEILLARERSSGRKVAIHRLRPAASRDAATAARFAKDASRSRELFHPNILRVFSIARDEQSPYCVLEWPEFGTLADQLQHGPLAEDDVLAVAISVAEALRYAHSRGVQHGRVRPSCVVFMEDGTVRLAGFGDEEIGAFPSPALDPDPYELHSDLLKSGGFDPSVDVFSFGGMLYHALTGDAPFSVALALVPQRFRDLLQGCLALKRSQRLPDFDAVIAAIERIRRAESDATNPPRPTEEQAFDPEAPRAPQDSILFLPEGAAAPSQAGRTGSGRRSGSGSGGSASGSAGSGGSGRTATFPYRSAEDLYEIVGDPLAGGMGTVHKAVERSTGRYVAIKRIHATQQMDVGVVARFHREALSIAKLNHPYILQLLQPARDDEGDYLVLEWAGGGSLIDKVKAEKRLHIDEVVEVGRKIGSALAYAHSKGVVHRDIKPHNILLTETGEPKLADFGLVRSIDDNTLSSSKASAGTPLYMAPEQWVDSREADARSDLYSLGKTLYHLITGLKPATIDPAKIPESIRAALMGCLADEPNKRFKSAEDFLAALESNLQPRRSRAVAVATWSLLVVLLVAGGLGYWKREEVKAYLKPPPDIIVEKDPNAGRMDESLVKLVAEQEFASLSADRRSRLTQLETAHDRVDRKRGELGRPAGGDEEPIYAALAADHAALRGDLDTLAGAVNAASDSDELKGLEERFAALETRMRAMEAKTLLAAEVIPARRAAASEVAGIAAQIERIAPLVEADAHAEHRAAAAALATRLAAIDRGLVGGDFDAKDELDALVLDAVALRPALARAIGAAAAGDDEHVGERVDARLAAMIALDADAEAVDAVSIRQRQAESEARQVLEAARERHASLVAQLEQLGQLADGAATAAREGVTSAGEYLTAAGAALYERRAAAAKRDAAAAAATLDAARTALEADLVAAIEDGGATRTFDAARRSLAVLGEIAPQHPRLAALSRRVGFVSRCPPGCEIVIDRHGASGYAQVVRHVATGIELALVEPGEFTPWTPEGSKLAPPRVAITRPFYVGRTEVTVAQWRRFVEAKDANHYREGDDFPLANPWPGTAWEYTEQHPVVNVQFDQAERYCGFAGSGMRLPTEMEWEFAARAGSPTRYWWGKGLADAMARENLFGPATAAKIRSIQYPPFAFDDDRTCLAPAASFGSIGFNSNLLHDVIGNASEWCADRYVQDPIAVLVASGAERVDDPRIGEAEGGDPTLRVARGGSWKSNPERTSCAGRVALSAEAYEDDVGFRVVLDPQPDP
jgi:serine/threonine protein kinase/formylglycine-generating enzyme required for sulfatase activity